jgi:hypothetical protein
MTACCPIRNRMYSSAACPHSARDVEAQINKMTSVELKVV